ncbi:hypothetical protein ROTAS13_01864 [Roseomonas sp. TAS13]|uniref:hypothetical protein n=1 Tax=Roseomonas TaxID=125216 RepID=UPI0009630373|nr:MULTISPECIES: hypothetical protein [Roseomonas]MCG7352635.1 hypothetical protein [Roseomonas mucosa]MCG7358273.1 hypothetical protein [Roseomonas mucosa]GAV34201.1 hypothetical protein ROTAS13_01864 [Roseomonas sp. TAS13]
MRIELLPGLTNVIRFPVERRARPTLELLREIAPDPREVGNVAEAFGLDYPVSGLRDAADASTAEYIRKHVPSEPGEARQAALRGVLEPLLTQAVTVCRDAHEAAVAAGEAHQALARAQTEGGFWIEPLEEQAEELSARAAELLVQAQLCSEQAEGAARAVRIAQGGKTWAPADRDTEFAEAFGLACSA